MNSLQSILSEKGYMNKVDNRTMSVRCINKLIDNGLMSIKLISYEESKEYGYFWKTTDGKRCKTLYKITLFNKTYYGHFMPAKQKNEAFGEKYLSDIDYKFLNIDAIFLRICSLISLNKSGFDFLKDGSCSCVKCEGKGIIPAFFHYANGVCFDCGGSGIEYRVLKSYMERNIELVLS